MPHVKVYLTKNIKETFELHDGDTIGRGKQSSIILLDQAISRTHGRFQYQNQKFYLTNIATNPFYINQKPIESQTTIELQDGDTIDFGSKTLEYSSQDDDVSDDFVLIDLIHNDVSSYPDASIFGKPRLHFKCLTDEKKIKDIEGICNRYLTHLDVDVKSMMGLETVLNESLNNAARHAHKYEYNKLIQLHMILKPHEIRYQVTDQGPGFDYASSLDRGREVDAVQAARDRYKEGGYGGLGFILMLKCVDHIEFNNTGNKVSLIKLLNPPIKI